MKKFISIILALVMFFTMSPISAMGVVKEEISTEDFGFEIRLLSVFNALIEELKKSEDVGDMRVTNIKTAIDFAGNEYYIAECTPSGYMIFNADTGAFIEYSYSASSPYLEFSDGLYYCGPTFYFIEESTGELVHTIVTNEVIMSYEKNNFIDSCQQFYVALAADSNQLVIDYLNGQYGNQDFMKVVLAESDTHASTQETTYGYLKHDEFFYNMQQCGYYSPPGSDGICGYIGLGLLIAYKEKYNSSYNYMSEQYWADSTHNNLVDGTGSLAWYLRRYHGSSDGTTSVSIKSVSESYFANRNSVSVNHVSRLWGTFTRQTIMDSIDADNPVLLFGNLYNPQNPDNDIMHAVVAYKYTNHSGLFGKINYTTHYGWDGYENIYVSGGLLTLGSIYILE